MRLGVFDSGIGGLTVLSELRRRLRGANFVYFGDTANVPYGGKSPTHVKQLSRLAALQFRDKKVDALIVACNTASSVALPDIRDVLGNVPVLGVVEPGVEAVLEAFASVRAGVPNRNQPKPRNELPPILVLATRGTIRSGIYGRLFRELLDPAVSARERPYPVIEQACPLLVPMIEEGWVDHPILHQTIQEYVRGYAAARVPGVCLLGCTHYPWIHSAVEKALPGWRVVNSAQAIANSVARTDFWQRYQKALGPRSLTGAEGPVEWSFSDPDALPEFAHRFIQTLEKQVPAHE
jgi:glutamate racemase